MQDSANEHNGRLPKHVKPKHYDIVLDTDVDKGEYHGAVTIE